MTREGIRHNIGGSQPVDYGEVEVGEELQPMCLTAGEVGLGVDVLDGPIVGDDGEVATLEIVAPQGEALDDGQELTLMVRVFLLGGGEAGGVIGDNAFIGARALSKESAGGELRKVSMEGERLGEVGGGNDGGSGEGELEVVEGGDGGG